RQTKQISDFLVNFAKERNYRYIQDESNNVVIFKNATPGYENAPTVILQGHTDMVTEKAPESAHDFSKDPLELMIEGDFITAKDTTLGADDGIAVAYMLAILDSKELAHPALECIFTSDEEIGLLGATALDCSELKGSMMINIDSEEEGALWVGCAGGLTGVSKIPVKHESVNGLGVEVLIDGLKGGHSGAEIDKHRANANILMGRFLHQVSTELDFSIVSLAGGLKDNAITRQTRALLVMEEANLAAFEKMATDHTAYFRDEYSGTDEGITVSVKVLDKKEYQAIDRVSKEKVLFFLMNIPMGIQKMSGEIEGLVETSTNLGILDLKEEYLLASSSVRSSKKSGKEALAEKHRYLTEFLGGEFLAEGSYPAWEYKKDSRLREIMKEAYQEELQVEPKVVVIHAGLECGLFYEKIKNLDCVSFGPTMHGIHTTEEELSISSTERMWRYLVKVLESIKE
ncbi:MAG TPA: aminoacyl-histidine dipeptidase, partial [Lachnospiraceae bacterium]